MSYKIPSQKAKLKRGSTTKSRIIATALLMAEEIGYSSVSVGAVAKSLELQPSNIFYYFGTLEAFHNALLRIAIKRSNYIVIAQGIAAGNPIALSASQELQRKALEKVSKCHYMKQQEN